VDPLKKAQEENAKLAEQVKTLKAERKADKAAAGSKASGITAPGLKKYELTDYAKNRLRRPFFIKEGKQIWLNHPELPEKNNITDEVVESLYGDDEGNFKQYGCNVFQPKKQ